MQPKAINAVEELKKHLSMARRNGTVVLTDDYSSNAGDVVTVFQAQRLNSASIVLAMLCADTLADDGFDASVKAALRSGKRLIPVVVAACDWTSYPGLGRLAALEISSGEAAVAKDIVTATQK
jgi:hypothetical protein